MSDEPVAGPEVSAEVGPSGVEAMGEAFRERLGELLGEAEGRYRDLDALMTGEELAAAICDALGITPELLESVDVLGARIWKHAPEELAAPLSVLLHAAGRTTHEPEEGQR